MGRYRFKFLWNQFKRYLKEKKYRYKYKENNHMKINIVTPGPESGWIIYKFGKTVYDTLIEMGYDATISDEFDPKADINHYFQPNTIGYSKTTKVNDRTTFMITHIDTALKLDQIIELTKKGAVGVCMSKETKDRLIANGVRANRICYINPAQDGMIQPKKVTLGFTYRIYSDNRKRDNIILDACEGVNPDCFRFAIMGAGWEEIVKQLEEKGFEVEYYPEFDKQKYNELMPTFDYYCYFGFDEGSMGYLDAMAAGVGTIITPQGYHLDTGIDITYPVCTVEDIRNALLNIQAKREKYFNFAKTWTWENYVKKHIELWKYILKNEELSVLLSNRGKYTDGIFSLLLDDLANDETLLEKIKKVNDDN